MSKYEDESTIDETDSSTTLIIDSSDDEQKSDLEDNISVPAINQAESEDSSDNEKSIIIKRKYGKKKFFIEDSDEESDSVPLYQNKDTPDPKTNYNEVSDDIIDDLIQENTTMRIESMVSTADTSKSISQVTQREESKNDVGLPNASFVRHRKDPNTYNSDDSGDENSSDLEENISVPSINQSESEDSSDNESDSVPLYQNKDVPEPKTNYNDISDDIIEESFQENTTKRIEPVVSTADISNSISQVTQKVEESKNAVGLPNTSFVHHREEANTYNSDDSGSDASVISGSFTNDLSYVPDRDPKLDVHSKAEEQIFASHPLLSSTRIELNPDVEITNFVTKQEYNSQKEKVASVEAQLKKTVGICKKIDLHSLPDNGEKLIKQCNALRKTYDEEQQKLVSMVVKNTKENLIHPNVANENPILVVPLGQKNVLGNQSEKKVSTWDDLEANAAAVQPKTFGKQALNTLNVQKALTLDTLSQLHGSLKSRPDDNIMSEDPKGLKVKLMDHQKRALTWLEWREQQVPSGGILADDMGLGKTLTMISLILKMKPEDDDYKNEDKWCTTNKRTRGGNLVVCPASLFEQWKGEVDSKLRRGLLSVEMYHGARRERNHIKLAKYDVVLTTYSIIMNEATDGTIFRVRWRRIILDEAHQVRNHKSQTSEAICGLKGKSRWALTGTPVHNRELDLYALLKFLRCAPFDDLPVWKRWVADKSVGGQDRLNTVISSLMLRRTKAELQQLGLLQDLPERKWELIPCKLDEKESFVYQKILLFSRTLFTQFLHQRAEKNTAFGIHTQTNAMNAHGPNGEYYNLHSKLRRFNKVQDIKQHDILVLLLRLRQICCHPSLILKMLKGEEDVSQDENYEEDEQMNLLEQLNKLTLLENNTDDNNFGGGVQEATSLAEASRNILNPSNIVFSPERESSKIKTLLRLLRQKILASNDKAIVVSQWSSLLDIVGHFLKKEQIPYSQFDGKLPVHKRADVVSNFNDPKSKFKVLLLSLTAGGVGLNLVGANHLVLLDLHWNPQLEMQAQDRIYRVGQTKPVFVYKLMVVETIEERIKLLQEKKLDIAESILTGTKVSNKLTLDDLKMLFNM